MNELIELIRNMNPFVKFFSTFILAFVIKLIAMPCFKKMAYMQAHLLSSIIGLAIAGFLYFFTS